MRVTHVLGCLLWICLSHLLVSAQSSSQNGTAAASPTATRNTTVVLTTSAVTTTTVSQSDGQAVTITTIYPSVYNVTLTPTATSTATPSSTSITLATKLDPAFGVLGAILIITGLPSAFWGHKNRWSSFFLIGFYTLSLVCFVLILKFGILTAVNPPSPTLRGMFVLACAVAGIAGGAITIFFWKTTKYFIGGWGGLAVGFWIQCFRDGGLIRTIGLRWILYIACAAVGFVLCTIPKIHYHILLVATACVGASAFILGVDCYTTAGLKEFYIWNLGFRDLFPKYASHGIQFPVSQTMQIELGLIGAIALMGMAVQLRVLVVLRRKLKEIQLEQKKRDEENEAKAAQRFADLEADRTQWEREHPTLWKHGRSQSGWSNTPLMKDGEWVTSSPDPTTPGIDEKRASTFSLANPTRQRLQSGVSDLQAAPPPEDEIRRISRHPQSPGALPALDLGLGIEDDVPKGFIAPEKQLSTGQKDAQKDGLHKRQQSREELLAEIHNVRKTIDVLKAETESLQSSGMTRSRQQSLSSRRTLSQDLGNMLQPPSHLRPPRQRNPRGRTQSMELSVLADQAPLGASVGVSRPTSVPLQDDWDSYVRDRKLLQPPAGVTPPIATTPLSPATPTVERIAMPTAVADALANRVRRESMLGIRHSSTPSGSDSDNAPLATLASPVPAHARHGRSRSTGPVNILPPRKSASPTARSPAPAGPPRTYTFEELTERHREKIREMQTPLTQAVREHAQVEAAKSRWERSKAVEKQAVEKRLAEKEAQLASEKKKREDKRGEAPERHGRRASRLDAGAPAPERSLSADGLAALPGAGAPPRRMSALKVETWQREQQHQERARSPPVGGAKRESVMRPEGGANVPFPEQYARSPSQARLPAAAVQDRRRSGPMMGGARDPPS